MQINLEVDGFEKLFKNMDELKEEIGKTKTDAIWKSALTEAFRPVLDSARERAPVNTGQMMEHIQMNARRPTSRDKRSIYYAGESYMVSVYVSPQRDDEKVNYRLNKKGKIKEILKPVAVSQEFGNARVPAHPFMRVSLESNYDQVITRLQQALSDKLFNAWDKLRNMKQG